MEPIKRWQAEVIHRALGPGLRYLCRLKARMEKVGFRRDDPLYVLVREAYEAVSRLSVNLHYRSCDKREESKVIPWDEVEKAKKK